MSAPMDELRFHQKLLENPHHLDEEMQAFLKEHPHKQEAVKQARKFEVLLEKSFNIAPPEDLQERILLRHSFDTKSDGVQTSSESCPRWQTGVGWFAAAFITAVVGLGLWTQRAGIPEGDPVLIAHKETAIISHILEHAQKEPALLQANTELDDQEIKRLFRFVGARLQKPIDFMTYAGECTVDGQKGLHVVLQEEGGPVNILVLPNMSLDAMHVFAEAGFKGQLLPVKAGLVAIIGHNEKQLAMAQMHFFKSVSFDS